MKTKDFVDVRNLSQLRIAMNALQGCVFFDKEENEILQQVLSKVVSLEYFTNNKIKIEDNIQEVKS